MQSTDEILSLMDLLDLDEEVIDVRSKSIMNKENFTNEQLKNLIKLLSYKLLINKRENCECENDEEYTFIVKLIPLMNDDNIDYVCEIIEKILSLQPSSIVDKSEHLLQQLLYDIHLPSPKDKAIGSEFENYQITLLKLKIVTSILNLFLFSSDTLSLPFLDIPLENLIFSKNEKLQIYFLTYTVPRLFETVCGYNILDRVWDVLKENKDTVGETALQVLCCLSNFYLPVVEGAKAQSDIIFHNEFWDFVIYGMLNKDNALRKQSIYLAKRALDCVVDCDKNIEIETDNVIFCWDVEFKDELKKVWDNYFVLLDSLDEKQGNIVLPSLKLFNNIESIGGCWLNCAFMIGLSHDNAQVRHQCLTARLKMGIGSELEALTVLEAFNDVTLFETVSDFELMSNRLKFLFTDFGSFMHILHTAPQIKWAPVPLHNMTLTMSDIKAERLLDNINPLVIMDLVCNLSKIPCNHVILRQAIHINIAHFAARHCQKLPWKDYLNMYQHLQLDVKKNFKNPCADYLHRIAIDDLNEFLTFVPKSYMNVDFAVLYFETRIGEDLLNLVYHILTKIEDINRRQYSDRNECFQEAIFILQFYKKSAHYKEDIRRELSGILVPASHLMLDYMASLLINDIEFDIEQITTLIDGFDFLKSETNFSENTYIIELYKTTLMCIKEEEMALDKKTLAIFECCSCLKTPNVLIKYEEDIMDLNDFVDLVTNVTFNETANIENSGRLRNAFYEKSCEIMYLLVKPRHINKDLLAYIYNVLDCGGYGCLKWVLKTVNKVFATVLKMSEFKVTEFLERMWKEIEELKSNNQYNICIQEFVILMTQDALLKIPEYNNTVIAYADKIIQYAAIKSTPLYFLVRRMNETNVSSYSHMIYVLCDVLLYTFLPKKDHRFAEKVCIELFESSKFAISNEDYYLNCNIKVLAVSILAKIYDIDSLNLLVDLIMEKVEDLFKNKQRYYANSVHERCLEAALQNLLFIFFKCRKINLDHVQAWAMEFLGKIPHQPYVRIYFEWFISLNYYIKESMIDHNIVDDFEANKLPLQSQFMILYWLLTHKLKLEICQQSEFDFVMNFLLGHIMGPTYSTRMYAQYFSTKIFECNIESINPLDCTQYVYTIEVITKTLDVDTIKEKSFVKLTKDYYVHVFDMVEDLSPYAIYWGLPQLYEGYNDTIDTSFIEKYIARIVESVVGEPDKFFKEWAKSQKYNWTRMRIHLPPQGRKDDFPSNDDTEIVQKKYVPWKNMSDVGVYDVNKKKNRSNLIVVASLIDKLPNLGGMARTSEVFGVETYVINSLRHLQDKQFQGLSVSAERWVDVKEVRPGQTLKAYILGKKAEGYTIVAAEQTSNSKPIQKFSFPKKTVLLLGHEKEGVPCDLLPLMDSCVEIPQQGVIRSLNVHVTAAIFIWEYARQNMLQV